MLTPDEALRLIRDFEKSTREYLKGCGMSEHEMGNSLLERQWSFLHSLNIPRLG